MKGNEAFIYWKDINLQIGKKVSKGFCSSDIEYT